MVHEVARQRFRQYSAARVVMSWYLDTYFRTREDIGVPVMSCHGDRIRHLAFDVHALVPPDEEMLYKSEGNHQASERDCGNAAAASCDGYPKALPRHHPRPTNLTPNAPCA